MTVEGALQSIGRGESAIEYEFRYVFAGFAILCGLLSIGVAIVSPTSQNDNNTKTQTNGVTKNGRIVFCAIGTCVIFLGLLYPSLNKRYNNLVQSNPNVATAKGLFDIFELFRLGS